ncbi:Membrane associated serine protease, rhomboid family [Salinibacillus kushneri]|uniref:Membrane associated serine protease, rhomboid family n=1 Tax=Salinibacillus kushneri TaxID=237682 RepID=A0A1I0BI50_9BACI|nr:rhomboid family intramembrane serine protease [Salinibacillus kushneri]SET06291.1 Membrane associated serine protease, rhomboid family [Salinibacillus kushneri]
MFIRTESFQEFLRFYPVVSVIVAINLGLWLLTEFLPIPFFDSIRFLGLGQNGLISNYNEYWRLFTAIFFHFGLMHAIFNSFSLVLFGPALESMLGKVRFILLYALSGVIGNLATLWLGSMELTHAGASGAIFGLFGTYLFIILFRKELLDYQSTQIITAIMIIALIMTFLRTNINIYAHIFGFIGGFALANILLSGVRKHSNWL